MRLNNVINTNIKNYTGAKNFDEFVYIFKYDGEIRNKLIDYKFNEKSYLYKTFVQIMKQNEAISKFIEKYDLIIPVPIHKVRKNERGYNQSELISKELSRNFKNLTLGKNILIKNINNKKQSSLTKSERITNVKGVYKVQNIQNIIGKNILIFDDIYTTGNTVNECSKVLKMYNINNIGIITIAKD